MKKLLKKIIQSSKVILISWIVVYGNVYAQQACCSTIVDACIPAFNRISDSYTIGNSCRTSPSHHRNRRLQPIHCSENFLAEFGAKNACCKTDRCDRYNQGTYFNPSFPQYAYLLQKDVSSFHVSDGEQRAFGTYGLSTSLKAVPIYILTQSIII
jgi:hypothetical protein